MGTFGRRPTINNNDFKEPILIQDVKDMLDHAKQNGWIDKNGNVDVQSIATHENIKIVYERLDSSVSGYLKQVY